MKTFINDQSDKRLFYWKVSLKELQEMQILGDNKNDR